MRKSIIMLSFSLALAAAAYAVPPQVEALAESLVADGAGTRAACNEKFGDCAFPMGSCETVVKDIIES